MAKVIADEQVVDRTWYIWLRTIIIGAGLGLTFWILTILLGNYVIEPLACANSDAAVNCANATPLAGNIAAILTGLLGILVMVRMAIFRPIILAAAAVVLFWDLAAMTNGLFWVEAILWSIFLYAASYGLFAWIARYSRLWAVITISALIVLIIRIALVL